MAATRALHDYLTTGPEAETDLRSVVLFGRNTASYKFALAESLFDLAKNGHQSVSLEELAEPYTSHMVEHARHAPRQAVNPSSAFVSACVGYANGTTTHDALIDEALRSGFTNVLDRFHTVNQVEVPVRLFAKDFKRGSRRIDLTDEMMGLAQSPQVANIVAETESRWHLVETAWQTGVSANLLGLAYDETTGLITANGRENRRRDVTSVRGALDGYQKGYCFYCYARINTEEATAEVPLCDVDHFLPHVLGRVMPQANLDGVWNLVLACPDCNRGDGGKFSRIPAKKYLERLHRRNEYLITSHHPLRETIIAQTGASPKERWEFLSRVYAAAEAALPGAKWETKQREEATF